MKSSRHVRLVTAVAFMSLLLVGAASNAESIADALESPVSLSAADVHLENILQQLTESCDVNLVLDNRVVAPVGVDNSSKAYATDGMLQHVDLKQVTLHDALTAVLTPLGLSYAVQKNYIWISTPTNLRHEAFEDLQTRSYPLPYLLVPDVNADTRSDAPAMVDALALLSRVVPDILEPQTGRSLSYIRYNTETKQLVVYNTPSNLKRVELLLELISPDAKSASTGPASKKPSA